MAGFGPILVLPTGVGLTLLLTRLIINLPRDRQLDSDQRIVSLIRHGLYVTGNATISLGVLLCSKAARELLLDLRFERL